MRKQAAVRIGKILGWVKAPRLTYLIQHPVKGPKNLLALRGAKALLTTRTAKVAAAAVATTVVALPMVAKVVRNARSS
jgi:hypothetical protein